jgi:hypothetical protein
MARKFKKLSCLVQYYYCFIVMRAVDEQWMSMHGEIMRWSMQITGVYANEVVIQLHSVVRMRFGIC